MTIREKYNSREMKQQWLENLAKSLSDEEKKNRGKVKKAWESMKRYTIEIGHRNAIYERNGS